MKNLIQIKQYEKLAKAKLDKGIWASIECGSGYEKTVKANCSAFDRIWFRPRVLVDVSKVNSSTSVLGIPIQMPIMVAPTGAHCYAHPEGECASVKGAGDAGTLYVASSSATKSLEEISRNATGPLWFQLYVYHDREVSAGLVRRAEKSGYKAIVLTADTPRYGRKERLDRIGFTPPVGIRKANFDNDDIAEVTDTLTWEALDWLRSITKLPIVVKGILTADDALLTIEHGANAIIVSNHGGRQLDSVIPTITALPEVAGAVNGRIEVYMDGGIRSGTDVLKALALGARAVLVGRPILWGLTVNGSEGVKDVLGILQIELEQAMALSGRPTLENIDSTLLQVLDL